MTGKEDDGQAPADGQPTEAPPFDARPVELEIRIPKLLRLGLWLSIAFMVVGIAAAVASPGNAHLPLRFRDIPAALAALDPRGLLGAGILLLLVTPLARVLASILHFARERDRLYVGLTAIVALNLAIAVGLGAL